MTKKQLLKHVTYMGAAYIEEDMDRLYWHWIRVYNYLQRKN